MICDVNVERRARPREGGVAGYGRRREEELRCGAAGQAWSAWSKD
jgi:hypothetical protein